MGIRWHLALASNHYTAWQWTFRAECERTRVHMYSVQSYARQAIWFSSVRSMRMSFDKFCGGQFANRHLHFLLSHLAHTPNETRFTVPSDRVADDDPHTHTHCRITCTVAGVFAKAQQQTLRSRTRSNAISNWWNIDFLVDTKLINRTKKARL